MSNKTYDDNNSGIIGKNDYKEKDTHPDVRGRAMVGGLWYWVSGWNKSGGGREFTSLAFTLMTQDEVDKMQAKRAEKQKPQQPQGGQPQQQPQQRQQQQAPQQQTRQEGQPNPDANQDFDDDIPF